MYNNAEDAQLTSVLTQEGRGKGLKENTLLSTEQGGLLNGLLSKKMNNSIRQLSPPPLSKHQLREYLLGEWHYVPPVEFQRLGESMMRSTEAVLETCGAPTPLCFEPLAKGMALLVCRSTALTNFAQTFMVPRGGILQTGFGKPLLFC